jgi:hypothetical protein
MSLLYKEPPRRRVRGSVKVPGKCPFRGTEIIEVRKFGSYEDRIKYLCPLRSSSLPLFRSSLKDLPVQGQG